MTCRILLVATLLSFATASAWAAAPPDTAGPQQLVDEATRMFEVSNFGAALERFQQAYAITGAPGLLFMVARCYQEKGEIDLAIRAYERFLKAEDVPQRARERAKTALVELREMSRTGTLVLDVEPAGADVSVDGESVGRAPLAPLSLPAGKRTVSVRADGHRDELVEVVIAGTKESRLTIRLKKALPPLQPMPAPSPPVEPNPAHESTLSPWQWVTLGTGLALTAGGTVAYILGEMNHRDITDAEGYGTDGVTQMDYSGAREKERSGDQKKLAGYVLWGVGGATLVASTVLFVVNATSDSGESVQVGAAPTPGGAIFSMSGSF